MNSICIFCGQETVISSASNNYCTNCGSDWMADDTSINIKEEINKPSVSIINEDNDYSDLYSPI